MIDLGKIAGHRVIIYIFTVVSLIIPGIGYIYITNESLFSNLEITRLILLSLFYSLPLYLICFMASMFSAIDNPPKYVRSDPDLQMMWRASIFTLFSFYAAMVMYRYPGSNIPLFLNSLLHLMYFVGFLLSVGTALLTQIDANSQKIIKRIDGVQVSISKFVGQLRKKRK